MTNTKYQDLEIMAWNLYKALLGNPSVVEAASTQEIVPERYLHQLATLAFDAALVFEAAAKSRRPGGEDEVDLGAEGSDPDD